MARRFPKRIHSPRAAVPGWAATFLARPAQPRRRVLQFERLEDRLAMDGDTSLATDVLAGDEGVAAVADDAAAASQARQVTVDDLPEQFQSEAELEAWLIEAAVTQWGHLFGTATHYPNWYWRGGYLGGDINVTPIVLRTNLGAVTAFDSNAMLFGSTNSSTNVQIEGVDEADLVETDGEYLYILSGNNLVIVEAGIGDELRVLSRVQIEDNVVGMYLDGDRLAIVSTSAPDFSHGMPPLRFATDFYYSSSQEQSTATVTVFDIADRSAPTLVQKSELDGRLVASRMVDGQLRLVVSHSLDLPQPIARPMTEAKEAAWRATQRERTSSLTAFSSSLMLVDYHYVNPPTETPYVYETREEYLDRVKAEILESAMPGFRVLDVEGEVTDERPLFDATELYRPDSPHERQITTVATFLLSDNEGGPSDTVAVFAATDQVYATANSVYLFSAQYYSLDYHNGPQTVIRKVDFESATGHIELVARGQVRGTVLNQFAADEYEGHLRVVAGNDWEAVQSVFVLKKVGRRLETVGSIGDIAPGEQIYSVRFLGERAYFVTFRIVDPLFSLDLSDPTDPKVAGELKISGYSDYLQPIGENQLLAIGRGADETTGLFQELQVSIFDILDLSDPQLAHRYSFDGGRAIVTPATGDQWVRGDGDHHAVSYFAEAGVFALPIVNSGVDGWWWNSADSDSPLESGEGGLQLFRIDATAGFTPIGLIQHDTHIQRAVAIGNHLFAISDGTITVHELTDPTMELGSLEIGFSVGASWTVVGQFRAPMLAMATFELPIESASFADDFSDPAVAIPPALAAKLDRSVKPVPRPALQQAFAAVDDLLLYRRSRIEISVEQDQQLAAEDAIVVNGSDGFRQVFDSLLADEWYGELAQNAVR